MIHICQDELIALGFLGSIGAACRYCWYKVTWWKR